MSVTRIKNNQITDAIAGNIIDGINANAKIQDYSVTSGKLANNITYASDLTITGNLSVTGTTTAVTIMSASGNVTGNNINTANEVSAGGNVTGGNIYTANDVSAGGNVQANAVLVLNSGAISTGGNVYGANVLATVVSASGNVNGNNVNVTTNVSVGGNVQANAVLVLNSGAISTGGNVSGANVNVTTNVSAGGNVEANAVLVLNGGAISTGGNVYGANVLATTVSASGNIDANNVSVTTGASVGGNVTANNVTAGNIVSAAGNVVTSNFFVGDGYYISNINPGNVAITKIVNGGTFANIASANGNLTIAVGASSNLVATFYDTGVDINGTASVGGNVNAANVNVSANVSATGNVYAANFATTGSGGNITGANVISATTVTTTGSIFAGANLSAAGNVLATGYVSAIGNVDGGNINTANNVSASANVIGGNVLSNGALSATGTANVGNLITNGLISATGNAQIGNILTGGQVSASGNVTGNVLVGSFAEVTNTANVGNLTTQGFISATGNVQFGNVLTGGRVSATGDVFGNNVSAVANVNAGNVNATIVYANVSASGQVLGLSLVSDFLYSTGNSLTISAVGTNSGISILANGTGNIGVGSTYINNLANPEQPQDAATKQYVDDVAAGLNIHDSTSAATGNTLTIITGGATTYYNGPANNGVGATITTTTSYTNIDGVAINTVGTRILVRAEANAVWNGVYVYSNATAITRATDYNQVPEVEAGDFIFNLYGTEYGNTGWVQTSNVSNVGQAGNNINFTQFSGAGSYTQGNGIAINGVVISTRINTGNLEYDGSGNLQVSTSAAFTTPNIGSATGSILSLTGNVTASVVGATELSASGNVYGGNVSASGTVVAVANIAGGNLLTGNIVSATGNVIGGNLITGGFLSVAGNAFVGNLSIVGNVISNIDMLGNITTGGYITAVGNVSGNNLSATTIISTAGNVFAAAISASGTVTANGTITGGNLSAGTGFISTTGSVDGGNVFATTAVSAGGNVTGGNVLTGGLISAGGTVTAGNVDAGTGFISTTGSVDGGNVFATTAVSAGGNVTGGNVLTGGLISASGNVTANNVTVGNIVSAAGNVVTSNFFVGDGYYISNINPGNVAITKLVNGGTFANIASADGNLVIAVGATSNVTATFANNLLAANGVISASGNIVSGNLVITPTQSIIGTTANANVVVAANGLGAIVLQNASNSVVVIDSTASNVTNTIRIATTGTQMGNMGMGGGGIVEGSYILGNGTPTQSQNRLLTMIGSGSENGTSIFSPSPVKITLDAAGDWSTGNTPTHISFWATPVGSNTAGEYVRVGSTGSLFVFYGNVDAANGNVNTTSVNATGLVSATGNVIAGNVSTAGQISAAGNVTVSTFMYIDPVDSTVLIGNSTIVACSVLSLNATSSFVVPVGNTAQRPSSTYTGMVRFNTSQNNLEIYDNSQWTPVGATEFTVISDQQFNGDGVTVAFTLSSTQTTNSCIVSINGVVQIPTLAYAVAGTNPTCVLTFTEAPAVGDVIDVRQITTTVTVTQIDNVSGNAVVAVSPTASQVNITGNLVTTVNSAAPTLVTNSTMSFQLISNTSLAILVRGTDGTTRSVALTLS